MSDKKIVCEATMQPKKWWNPDEIEFPQCSKRASVQIDGINLCLQHAGLIAVQKLINKGEIVYLKDAPKNNSLCPAHRDRWAGKVKSNA